MVGEHQGYLLKVRGLSKHEAKMAVSYRRSQIRCTEPKMSFTELSFQDLFEHIKSLVSLLASARQTFPGYISGDSYYYLAI